MTDLVIIGAGGFGREMLHHIGRINKEVAPTWNFVGFIDDGATSTKEGDTVLGGLDTYLQMDKKVQYYIAIANMAIRERIANRCREAGFTAATIIMPIARISAGCELGEGCYLAAVLKRNVKVGPFCMIQGGSVVGRDTEVGAFTSVMTGSYFGENVKIGKYNYFGLRCNVADGVTTADNCTFGACATVMEDTTVPGTYAGVPAVLKKPLIK